MPERLQTYQNGVEKSQCISIQCGGHSISFQLDWNLTQEHTPEHSQVLRTLGATMALIEIRTEIPVDDPKNIRVF